MWRVPHQFQLSVLAPLCAAGFLSGSVLAQTGDIAAQIYEKTSSCVFVISVRDGNGSPLLFGTGFLVEKNTIATNLHVVQGGNVFLEQGALRIPAAVEKRDPANDLAIIAVSVEIAATPLVLSHDRAIPGESIFAIGNPEGLEKSISTGVIAGLREFDGQKLLQITAPISLGSSGGPILNSAGEVIGVAVAMLKDGQNLNFAVPAELIGKLLKSAAPMNGDLSGLFDKIDRLDEEQKQLQFSNDPDSDWQNTSRKIDSILRSALEQASSNPDLLLRVAERAKPENWNIAIEAAERATRLTPSARSNFLLGHELYVKAVYSDLTVKAGLLRQAEMALRNAIQMSSTLTGTPDPEMYNDLAGVFEEQGSFVQAAEHFKHALQIGKATGNLEQQATSLRGLTSTVYKLNRTVEIDHWFAALVDTGSATPSDWQQQGARLDQVQRYADAGKSYRQAASVGGAWTNWCSAAESFAKGGSQPDDVLSNARECITAGTGKKESEKQIAFADYLISDVLNGRGVFSEALSHARQASDLDASNPWFFQSRANALFGLRRFQEAINASTQAIRLADGKYATMHFRLGASYFELENWEFARQSFEKAAELDATDASAPYKVALCYVRLGYSNDAAHWYEEVLRRNPNSPERAEIQRRILLIRGVR
ncbi:MAG: trypsin-like peptidase domain-containing protein [Bryobacteraceae bacterium]